MRHGTGGSEDGGGFETPEVGKYTAMLTGVVDMGERENSFEATRGNPGKMQPNLVLVWTLDARDSKGKRFQQYDWLVASTFHKSKYSERVAALLDGHSLNDSEREGFNPACLLGRFVKMTIDDVKKDGTKAKNPYISRVIETDSSFVPDDADVLDSVPKYCTKNALDGAQVEAWESDLETMHPTDALTSICAWRPGFDGSEALPESVGSDPTHEPSEEMPF